MKIALTANYTENPQKGLFNQITSIIGGNAAKKSHVNLSSSSQSIQRNLPGIIYPDWKDYILTHSKTRQYILIDFKNRKLDLNRYYMRTGPFPENSNHPKNWKVEGSNDDEHYICIDKQVDNPTLNGPLKAFLSQPIQCSEPYRYIKIKFGKNWSDKSRILLQNIEFFGTLYGETFESELDAALNYSEEDLNNLRAIFEAVDSNGNGQLEPEELTQFFKDVFPLPITMVPLAFRICDTDESGAIDFDEFAIFFQKLKTLKSDDPLPAYRMLFDAIDKDHKGSLDTVQFMEFAIFAQIQITYEDASLLIAEYDHDKDGRVTFDEIYQACLDPNAEATSFAPHALSEDEIQTLRKEFDEIDADGSGELDYEELTRFCGGSNPADLVFLLSNTDKSGSISFNKYIEFTNKLATLNEDENLFFQTIFDAIDEEKEGKLNKEQLIKFYRLVNVPFTDKELDEFVETHDDDKDGKLTYAQASDIS